MKNRQKGKNWLNQEKGSFAKKLQQYVPTVRVARKYLNKKQVWCWLGVQLKENLVELVEKDKVFLINEKSSNIKNKGILLNTNMRAKPMHACKTIMLCKLRLLCRVS